MSVYITKNFVIEKKHLRLVKEIVKERSLGERGDSIALRQIMDEWAEMKQERENNKSQADHA